VVDEINYQDAMMTMAADKMAELREQNIRYRAALKSIHLNAVTITGREAVQTLIDAGQLKPEELS
jgi:hypothetical protein